MVSFDTEFSRIQSEMKNVAKMQEITAHNITNANTPGFTPKTFDKVLGEAVDRLDNKSVNVEEEMAQLAKNNVRYSALVKMMTSKLNILRTIATQGRR